MLVIFTELADWLAYSLFGLVPDSRLGAAVHFFIEDTTKILFLLVLMIYVIALIRASLIFQPFAIKAYQTAGISDGEPNAKAKLSFRERHDFAKVELLDILNSVWKSVLIGVASKYIECVIGGCLKDIEVLGSGCAKCVKPAKLIQAVANDCGLQGHLIKESGPEVMLKYNVMTTPAVVVDNQLVHSGSVHDSKKVEKWLK